MLYDRTLIVAQYQARSNEDCSGVASYRKKKKVVSIGSGKRGRCIMHLLSFSSCVVLLLQDLPTGR